MTTGQCSLAIFFLLLLASIASAQTVYDINRARLAWSWTQGAPPNDGIPENFSVKCGQTSGNYTRTTQVAYPTKELALKAAIGGSGAWFCVVTAVNKAGESGPTNELPFAAEAVSSNPFGLTITQ